MTATPVEYTAQHPASAGGPPIQAVRGQPGSLATMGALLVGVVVTGFGYAVGRLRAPAATATQNPGRFAKLRPPPLEPAERIAVVALLVAVVLWLISLPQIRLDRVGDYGLIPLLPLTFWAALAVLLLSFASAVLRGLNRTALLAAYPVVLIAILHGTPSVRYGTLRYSWAWKHVGIVDFFLRHNGVDRSVHEMDVYQYWPGFFTANATLVKAAGLHSALGYAPWAPPMVNLALLAPLLLIYRSFTSDRRLIWSALVIFILGNWVGQDYFAPQAFAYFIYLTMMALCLRYLAPGPRGDAADRWRRRVIITIAVVLVATVAPTHQLTPVMVIVALAVLACCRYRVKVLLIAAIALTVGWELSFAWPWFVENGAAVTGSLGSLGHNTSSGFINLAVATPSQVMVAHVDRSHSAFVWVLGIVGFARRVRYHRERVLVWLAVAPLPLFVSNDYGGEMIFRVFLYGLPFVAFYAASAFFPDHTGGRSRLVRLAVPVVLLALVPGFAAGCYGKEQANYFSRNEVAVADFVFGTAPRGSLIVGETSDFPWAFMNYEFFDYERFALFKPEDRQRILSDPIGQFRHLMARSTDGNCDWCHHHAYLLITRSQIAQVEMLGAMPHGSIERIERTLEASPYFRVLYRNPDGEVITLIDPAQEARK